MFSDTYTFPVDPEIHNTSGYFSSPLKTLTIREASNRPQRKRFLGGPKYLKTYRSPPLEDLYIRSPSTVFHSPFKLSDVEGSRLWSDSECLPFRTSTLGGKGLLRIPNNNNNNNNDKHNHNHNHHQEKNARPSQGSSEEATALQDSIGILHNDPIVCSCCACHVLVKEVRSELGFLIISIG